MCRGHGASLTLQEYNTWEPAHEIEGSGQELVDEYLAAAATAARSKRRGPKRKAPAAARKHVSASTDRVPFICCLLLGRRGW
jgi:hypothetical protein